MHSDAEPDPRAHSSGWAAPTTPADTALGGPLEPALARHLANRNPVLTLSSILEIFGAKICWLGKAFADEWVLVYRTIQRTQTNCRMKNECVFHSKTMHSLKRIIDLLWLFKSQFRPKWLRRSNSTTMDSDITRIGEIGSIEEFFFCSIQDSSDVRSAHLFCNI